MDITIKTYDRTFSITIPDESQCVDAIAETARLFTLIYHPDSVVDALSEAKAELCNLHLHQNNKKG